MPNHHRKSNYTRGWNSRHHNRKRYNEAYLGILGDDDTQGAGGRRRRKIVRCRNDNNLAASLTHVHSCDPAKIVVRVDPATFKFQPEPLAETDARWQYVLSGSAGGKSVSHQQIGDHNEKPLAEIEIFPFPDETVTLEWMIQDMMTGYSLEGRIVERMDCDDDDDDILCEDPGIVTLQAQELDTDARNWSFTNSSNLFPGATGTFELDFGDGETLTNWTTTEAEHVYLGGIPEGGLTATLTFVGDAGWCRGEDTVLVEPEVVTDPNPDPDPDPDPDPVPTVLDCTNVGTLASLAVTFPVRHYSGGALRAVSFNFTPSWDASLDPASIPLALQNAAIFVETDDPADGVVFVARDQVFTHRAALAAGEAVRMEITNDPAIESGNPLQIPTEDILGRDLTFTLYITDDQGEACATGVSTGPFAVPWGDPEPEPDPVPTFDCATISTPGMVALGPGAFTGAEYDAGGALKALAFEFSVQWDDSIPEASRLKALQNAAMFVSEPGGGDVVFRSFAQVFQARQQLATNGTMAIKLTNDPAVEPWFEIGVPPIPNLAEYQGGTLDFSLYLTDDAGEACATPLGPSAVAVPVGNPVTPTSIDCESFPSQATLSVDYVVSTEQQHVFDMRIDWDPNLTYAQKLDFLNLEASAIFVAFPTLQAQAAFTSAVQPNLVKGRIAAGESFIFKIDSQELPGLGGDVTIDDMHGRTGTFTFAPGNSCSSTIQADAAVPAHLPYGCVRHLETAKLVVEGVRESLDPNTAIADIRVDWGPATQADIDGFAGNVALNVTDTSGRLVYVVSPLSTQLWGAAADAALRTAGTASTVPISIPYDGTQLFSGDLPKPAATPQPVPGEDLVFEIAFEDLANPGSACGGTGALVATGVVPVGAATLSCEPGLQFVAYDGSFAVPYEGLQFVLKVTPANNKPLEYIGLQVYQETDGSPTSSSAQTVPFAAEDVSAQWAAVQASLLDGNRHAVVDDSPPYGKLFGDPGDGGTAWTELTPVYIVVQIPGYTAEYGAGKYALRVNSYASAGSPCSTTWATINVDPPAGTPPIPDADRIRTCEEFIAYGLDEDAAYRADINQARGIIRLGGTPRAGGSYEYRIRMLAVNQDTNALLYPQEPLQFQYKHAGDGLHDATTWADTSTWAGVNPVREFSFAGGDFAFRFGNYGDGTGTGKPMPPPHPDLSWNPAATVRMEVTEKDLQSGSLCVYSATIKAQAATSAPAQKTDYDGP